MAFKADASKIRRWREERHWSQEHLAHLAGIGLRTVQRIETGEPASRDTLTALAAAFNVEAIALCIDPEAEAADIVQRRNREAGAGLRLSFWINLAGYLLGMVVFAGISLGMGTFVMKWPAIWWTIGLAGHGFTIAIVTIVARHQAR
ncbi:helix-turn-helix transcriptional regulator [Maricaulis sp.]|uniref:helix-turn-helix domain-containing protein n=1 Tax=Maricaulis sp. TaxID=1486257 RepID=UPI00262F392D|nr:helix-turn-helix transcriptional regulator [Maricaulis sp.]